MATNGEVTSDMMSLPQIAKYLGVAERTVYLWAQQGKVPAFKLGSSWRFKKAEIDAWIETTRTGPSPAAPGQLLTGFNEPPLSKKEIREAETKANEAMVTACVDYVEDLMRLEDRDVWTVESILDQFKDADLVDEALKRLNKEKKISRGEEKDLRNEKVQVIRRRN